MEPLYPRLGLLGGSAQEGKISKLAALAAARKKKTSDLSSTFDGQPSPPSAPSSETKSAPRSLSERLATNNSKGPIKPAGRSALSSNHRTTTKPVSKKLEPGISAVKEASVEEKELDESTNKQQPAKVADLRAAPSTFAVTIIGKGSHSTSPESGHLLGSSFDVMDIYQQDLTEAFDFTGPSPDDVVFNAQSASKGLPIRGPR